MEQELLVLGIGISPHKNDGVLRFENYCAAMKVEYRIVGEGEIWRGGNIAYEAAGGQKINELRKALTNMNNRLVIVCDSFDLFPIAGAEEIVEKYHMLCGERKNQIIFAAESFCWPQKDLADKYPHVNTKYRFLNSGSFIGYRDDIYSLICENTIKDTDDDQLYFTKKFLEGRNIMLDYNCELFQALCGAESDTVVHRNRLFNKSTNSYPIFIHGNGPAKHYLNHLENYIEPYPLMNYSLKFRPQTDEKSKIFMALYTDSSMTKEFELFLAHVLNIDYQNKIVYVYDRQNNEEARNSVENNNFTYVPSTINYIYQDFKNTDCNYYFLLEQSCIVNNRNILNELVGLCSGSKRIISPLVKKKDNQSYTNYWGDIDRNEYYKRADDYFEIIENNKRGYWNAPYVSGAILMHRDIVCNWDLAKHNKFTDNDNQMALCDNLRTNILFMYMVNFNHYGYINY